MVIDKSILNPGQPTPNQLRVENIKTYPCKIKIRSRLTAGTFAYSYYQTVVVRVSSAGEYGWGEAMTRHSPEATAVLIKDFFRRQLSGREFDRPQEAWSYLWQELRARGHTRGILVEALSALDIALWDIYAKTKKKTIAGLLSAQAASKIPLYAGSVFSSRGAIPTQLETVRSFGIKVVKVKVGFGIEKDVALLKYVRALWDDLPIVADVNGAYDRKQALKLSEQCEKYDLAWLEEPVPADDLEGYRFLARRQSVPIGAGETWFVLDFEKPISEKIVEFVEPSVSRCGGIGIEREVAKQAAKRGLRFAPMVGLNSAVSFAASLQVAAASKNLFAVEFDPFGNPLLSELATNFPEIRDGFASLTTAPGLGIEPDLGFLERHAV